MDLQRHKNQMTGKMSEVKTWLQQHCIQMTGKAEQSMKKTAFQMYKEPEVVEVISKNP